MFSDDWQFKKTGIAVVKWLENKGNTSPWCKWELGHRFKSKKG
ncbi:hypothetical protein QWZ16_10640 [Vibrio ostreicida]|uniref:Uncharacterized protein n=1 Tax=Vibrio ostreicida TaxID=526588 RepID=A0ABT8BT65_9VIBR|nr:hypothetical protein [Vibrio ostreicida]MDN3610158.1 hypothetical protein [Vibrio ostreicida]